ncbi:hypothetical protein M431DRAFT_234850 [Trichoderma harzianum CBS 226.95]|uniref:Uncharacterized protein n=1 Tax=Trichoderma harzianum CBS 226.95 TaxID=983964 RepID=A0A2T4A232_TRIHA|nr:hypothetical protein M431DRAFT_234850 [Trichoderma harzianum CBS 226.95]PTB51109.1 hypothetical protein M431DRAFT_234850 [Trichoderma harzianum CBS 226.95]
MSTFALRFIFTGRSLFSHFSLLFISLETYIPHAFVLVICITPWLHYIPPLFRHAARSLISVHVRKHFVFREREEV